MRSEWLMTQIPVFPDPVGALQSVANVYFDSLSHRTTEADKGRSQNIYEI